VLKTEVQKYSPIQSQKKYTRKEIARGKAEENSWRIMVEKGENEKKHR